MPRETFQQELDGLVALVIELGTEVADSLESARASMRAANGPYQQILLHNIATGCKLDRISSHRGACSAGMRTSKNSPDFVQKRRYQKFKEFGCVNPLGEMCRWAKRG